MGDFFRWEAPERTNTWKLWGTHPFTKILEKSETLQLWPEIPVISTIKSPHL